MSFALNRRSGHAGEIVVAAWNRLRDRAALRFARAGEASAAVHHQLSKRGMLAVQRPRGIVIECLQGCLWITIDHDKQDIVLEAGGRFRADGDDRALIQALEDTRMRMFRADAPRAG